MEDEPHFRTATEWFSERPVEISQDCFRGQSDFDNGESDKNCYISNDLSTEFENEQDLELLNVYPLTIPFRVGRIIQKMAPVTTFCATLPNNNHNLVINNLNRTKSLDNLNFEEKRQIIASTLSLADILCQGG